MFELTNRQRLRKQVTALILAFLFAFALAGGFVHATLSVHTVFTLLADLALTLSLSGTVAAVVTTQLMITVVCVLMLAATFSTFAAHSRSPIVTMLGVVGISIFMFVAGGAPVSIAVTLYILPPVMLCSLFSRRLDYKTLLMLCTVFLAVLFAVSLLSSVYAHSYAISVPALRSALLDLCADLAVRYQSVADQLITDGMQRAPSYFPPLRQDQAVLSVVNHIPAIFAIIAMLPAFVFVTYYRRASGQQPPKIGYVIDEFSVSQVGGGTFMAAVALSYAFSNDFGASMGQLMAVMSLPMSLQGIASIRRRRKQTGRGIPFLLLLGLMMIATPASILLFLAVLGALDVLIPPKQSSSQEGDDD